MPGNEGTYTLPEIRIDWWDTVRNAPRRTTIPARVLRVATGVQDRAETFTDRDVVTKEEQPAPPLWQWSPLWQGLCVLLLLLWFITLIAWRRARAIPRTAGGAQDHAREAPQLPPASLRRACLADDARAAREALLQWAAVNWPECAPCGLMGLAQRLTDAELRAELATLDGALYAPSREPWRGEPLWQRARTQLTRPAATQPAKDDGLPELYPRHS